MPKTVLVVEDSSSMRQMLKLTLGAAGYDVIEAQDGTEALAIARTRTVTLVVTDLNMPRMDGLALIRALRNLPAWVGTPVLFLTTVSDAAQQREARAAGATGWITKPFKQQELLATVRKLAG